MKIVFERKKLEPLQLQKTVLLKDKKDGFNIHS